MWGIIPAAGSGERIQPLAFSKELLPVGARVDGNGVERPRAVSEYLIERMARAGADKICFVISPWKFDILQYYGGQYYGGAVGEVRLAYVIQAQASGLCDAIFRAAVLIPRDEPVLIGLPDTVWFPEDALCDLPSNRLVLLLFHVKHPEVFDAVATEADGRVGAIEVKSDAPSTNWVWGAMRMPGAILHELHALWVERDHRDEYFGTLINAWIARGGLAQGVRSSGAYVDVGTLNGYREAMVLLASEARMASEASVASEAPGP